MILLKNLSCNKMNNSLGILEKWYSIRKQIKELEEKEKFLKYKIHQIMNQRETNTLRSEYFFCERQVRQRTDVKKQTIPEEIWDQYSQTYEYPVLLLKKNRIGM
jgi:hypothetical protein